MCTAISTSSFFGRNLDLEFSYGESITITPRRFPFSFSSGESLMSHYAIIGTALSGQEWPLYYDAINEKGLGCASLNFPEFAYYAKGKGKSVASYELIPYILSFCSSVDEAEQLLKGLSISDKAYSKNFPPSPLHYLIGDKDRSITVEATKEGLNVYPNPVGVLTNNPPFPYQMFALNNYMNLSAKPGENRFSDSLDLDVYSRGMGAIGLPGDLSSQSRFIKAVFTKMNYLYVDDELSGFMHILSSVEQQRGAVDLGGGKYEITIYSSAADRENGIYYYRTYENSQLTSVSMHKEDLDSDKLRFYPMRKQLSIREENQ